MDKLLSLRNVGVIRDGRTILQSDDLHIPLTGITALIGPNGAGKTTLLRLIHGLIEPSIGQCERPFAPNESALVFHYTPMLKATVREHLTLLRETDRTIRDETIDEALQSVGIAHLANNPAQRLSAGERQKLCFARARLQNPKLVLLDEPTANLDPNASDDVEQMIAQLAKDGKAVLFASHNMAQVKRLATHLIFMQDGKILEISSPGVFFKNPQTKEGSQFLAREFIAQ
ncbi:MAG: ATP-binding cassette domain-containing protein [Burkholderiaceae bacterium]|jgi:tungstate transport system ATP-binding protein|nr:ATP-binding cassette domain-containing protein [Burkholderiaceae bacterium]